MMKMLPVRQATAPSRSRLRLTQPQLQAEPRPLGSGRRASVYFRGRLRLVHPRPARTCLHQWWGMLQLANAGIRDVVAEAVALTRLNESDAELPPLAEPSEIGTAESDDVQRHFETTALATPEDRARAVAEAIGEGAGAGQTAAGIYSTDDSRFSLYNSRGVAARYRET